jgi:hypothetical protein
MQAVCTKHQLGLREETAKGMNFSSRRKARRI